MPVHDWWYLQQGCGSHSCGHIAQCWTLRDEDDLVVVTVGGFLLVIFRGSLHPAKTCGVLCFPSLSPSTKWSLQTQLITTVSSCLYDYATLIMCFDFLSKAVNHLICWSSISTKSEWRSNRGESFLLPLNDFFLVACRICLSLIENDLSFYWCFTINSLFSMHHLDLLSMLHSTSCEIVSE